MTGELGFVQTIDEVGGEGFRNGVGVGAGTGAGVGVGEGVGDGVDAGVCGAGAAAGPAQAVKASSRIRVRDATSLVLRVVHLLTGGDSNGTLYASCQLTIPVCGGGGAQAISPNRMCSGLHGSQHCAGTTGRLVVEQAANNERDQGENGNGDWGLVLWIMCQGRGPWRG